jgi:hypothetical protein
VIHAAIAKPRFITSTHAERMELGIGLNYLV